MKALGSGNGINYNRYEASSTAKYNNPLSPLSPNIGKNPMSPTAKIKMFSNTLNINKKNPINNSETTQIYQND